MGYPVRRLVRRATLDINLRVLADLRGADTLLSTGGPHGNHDSCYPDRLYRYLHPGQA